jgi:hypothetical protein
LKARDALNHYLRPDPITVVDAAVVGKEFRARCSTMRSSVSSWIFASGLTSSAAITGTSSDWRQPVADIGAP